jgi:RNase P/RNase MRP subunit POP5
MDARLFTHAGVLAARLGRTAEAGSWLTKARDLQRTLLPSERQQLAATLAALATSRDARSINPAGT